VFKRKCGHKTEEATGRMKKLHNESVHNLYIQPSYSGDYNMNTEMDWLDMLHA
jgi:hypothetical protein